jgi:3',5'-cyclic AMP phosphodiesterase CpdA
MVRPRRDPALALPALMLLLAACTSRPVATPSPTPSVPSVAPPVLPSASPTPSPKPVRPTVIAAFGDWGIRGGRAAEVVALMGRFRPLDAVVTTGDNAYGTGQRGEAAFARSLVEPLLRRRVPFYASLGNHDVVTRDGAHVMRELGIPGHWYARTVGPVQVVVLDSNRPSDTAQTAFLNGVLAAPTEATFRVVVFHHPAASCSLHGANRDVDRLWVPLLRGKADLVLAGHNHTYERFMVGTTPYVTTGGGGARLYPSVPGLCKGPGTPEVIKTAYHALRLTATPDRLLLEAVGLDGVVFDRYEIPPR